MWRDTPLRKMYAKMRSGIWIVRSMCSGDRKGKEEQGPRGEQAGIGSEAGGTGEAMYVTGDKLRCNDQMRQIFVETGGGKTIILDLLPSERMKESPVEDSTQTGMQRWYVTFGGKVP